MRMSDINLKLDRRIVLSLKQDSELVNFSKSSRVPVPVSVFNIGEHVYMDSFFPKDITMDQHLKLLVQRMEIKERRDAYVVRTRINNIESLKIINELFRVPSVVPNRIDIENGALHFYMRFHHNFQDMVSDLMEKYVENPEITKIDFLGPSDGLASTYTRIDSRYPLSFVSFDVILEEEARKTIGNITEGSIAELSATGVGEDGFSAILYTEDKLVESEGSIEKLVEVDNIYRINLRNNMLTEFRKKLVEDPIIRIGIFARLTGNRLSITSVVPTIQVHEYYNYLFMSSMKTGQKVSLKYICPYTVANFENI
ncbi:MAG: hypothetical protein AAE983_06960 [Thermoplasmataceae archaeon]|jgi:hypothetical protein